MGWSLSIELRLLNQQLGEIFFYGLVKIRWQMLCNVKCSSEINVISIYIVFKTGDGNDVHDFQILISDHGPHSRSSLDHQNSSSSQLRCGHHLLQSQRKNFYLMP